MEGAYYLFSTHSIPVDWSDKSGYAAQFERMTRLIVAKLNIKDWGICYQSRSGNPRDPWLVPDVCDAIEAIDRSRFPHLVVTPSGFLSDNVEVLYDIDIEAKSKAMERGFGFTRSETVMDHPSFIHLMADQVQTCLK
jgi:ferrochelatase